MRIAAAAAAVGALAAPALAQTVPPPAAAALRPLNLTTSWVTAVPVDGRADGVAKVQVADKNQIFVQTKRGVLVAMDAATGSQQWSQSFDTSFGTIYPVAWNDRYVFAVNVVKLYAFQRSTGVVEFTYNLPQTPSAGPAVDAEGVYLLLGAAKVFCYNLPAPLSVPEKSARLNNAAGMNDRLAEKQNPANLVASRYPASGRRDYFEDEQFESARVTLSPDGGSGAGALQRTPSLSVVPTVRPPYRLFDDNGKYIEKTESLSVANSLRQPYRLQDPTMRYNQRTPSVSVLPPSLAGLL
jgi:hypothetical protein